MLPSDFAIAPEGPEPLPQDIIDEKTWCSIIQLPDDVTIATTNDFGGQIRHAESIQANWVGLTLDIFGPGDQESSPFNRTVVNSFSELQASLFNAMCGYYRTGISALRNTLEHLTIGLDYELKHSRAMFEDWMDGKASKNIKFGNSASSIASKGNPRIGRIEARLMTAVGDNVFRQEESRKAMQGVLPAATSRNYRIILMVLLERPRPICGRVTGQSIVPVSSTIGATFMAKRWLWRFLCCD